MTARRHGNLAARLLLATALVTCAACGATQTPAQKLAWERWNRCQFPAVSVRDIAADGQIWLEYRDPEMAATVQECLARVALEQNQRFLIVKPPESLGSGGGPRLFGLPIKLEVSVGDIATAVAALIALVAALVALRQLGTMSRQAWAEVLLTIDERWEESKIPMSDIKADILKFASDVQAKYKAGGPSQIELLATELEGLRTTDLDRYRNLFRLVALLETMGYAARKGYVSIQDVEQLLGPSISEATRVFRLHISRTFKDDPRVYEHFRWLAEEVERRYRERVAREERKRLRAGKQPPSEAV
jgi:hypothetical protein